MPEADDAPVILSNTPGSFARGVLAHRHPALIQQVRDAFPYPPTARRALDELLLEITEGVIEPLAPDAHDRAQWDVWGGDYFGLRWFDAPFLWAESYFYRRLLGAVGFFSPGPWQGIDPFAPFKQAELRGITVDEELAALDLLAPLPPDDRATALLHASLWGNRADLGFRISSDSPQEDSRTGELSSRLVADDSALLWSLLPPGLSAGTVHMIADNAGRELIPDLVLLDHLLVSGRAERAVLHVKPYPYYVSDATTADVVDCLRRIRQAPGSAAKAGERLWTALAGGRLDVRAHSFFCAPLPFTEMPPDLRQSWSDATVSLVKGDLNYRRLVGDRMRPPTTSFAALTAYFPGPVAALRTLKSDVVVGLDAGVVSSLEAEDPAWRTSGTHAVLQTRPQAP
jgi:hypothetical protein